ncbi:MAG: hypothetical protein ACP5FZ_09705 [Fidelibacterota bacterium]
MIDNIEKLLKTVALSFSEEQREQLNRIMSFAGTSLQEDLIDHFDKQRFIVTDGELLVYHHNPSGSDENKTLIFVPGWGANLNSFRDCYASLINRVEIYHIETREKSSSRIDINHTNMSVEQNAHDIAAVLRAINIRRTDDYLIAETCWGSTILLQGLIENLYPPVPFILFDPMHALWFPKWLLKWIIPFTPVWLAKVIRPVAKKIALRGMKETVQRRRTAEFIDDGDLKKWKAAAVQARAFELMGHLSAIDSNVTIVNGTTDKIHDQRYYPLLASEIPDSNYLYMQTDESKRERLIGKVLYEFASSENSIGIPDDLKIFQKRL